MKRCILWITVILLLTQGAWAQTVIPGGNTIGLQLGLGGVSVVEFSQETPKKAGLERGDLIVAVNGASISSAQELKTAVQASEGKPLQLAVRRGDNKQLVTLAPTKSARGWELGVLVRDTVNGIGTVTYYDPNTGSFGALGHGVGDGKILYPICDGAVLPSTVAAVQRGKCGQPGALQGAIRSRAIIGDVEENTPQGIFGSMEQPEGAPMEVADLSELHTGPAIIRSNVRGTQIEEFSVKICAIYAKDSTDRNLLLEVTDAKLLQLTGGIVQGMSGSPILQDGKLVGAVTHVLVDDPTRGYGIAIEKMLQSSKQAA